MHLWHHKKIHIDPLMLHICLFLYTPLLYGTTHWFYSVICSIYSKYLVNLWVAYSVVLHAQVTDSGHELKRMQEKARAKQEGENVWPLK